jgi:DCN1-like protein 1/2
VHRKAISRDTWNQLFDFVVTVNDQLDKFDPDGAWPVLIDDFVAYMKARMS